jgi:hypothetical protein
MSVGRVSYKSVPDGINTTQSGELVLAVYSNLANLRVHSVVGLAVGEN